MSDVLNGNRVNLPDWRFVHEFVTACRSAATENGLDPNALGTVADWKRHWDGAASGVIDARFPGHDDRSLAVQEPGIAPAQAARESADPDGWTAEVDHPAQPSLWGAVPPRLPDFVGREDWLAALHRTLRRADRVGVVAIQGQFGVGKTQLAAEYAHRHANEYDLVWWIPCDDLEAARGALVDLAARVGATSASGEPEGYAELFDVLRRRQRFARWLLVFDNAHEPEEVKALIPRVSGDVLVTTRSSRWESWGDLLDLDVFHRAESVDFLRRRMRDFTDVAAHRLAEGVGDLPLLLEHAIESRFDIDAYLRMLESEPLRLLNEQPADYPATIASVWRTMLDQLRTHEPDALDLLCCLAFFGSHPVPRESLERGGYLKAVSVQLLLRDPIRLARAIRALRRGGLLRMRPGTRSTLDVHRVTQCVLRAHIADSGPAEAERVRHDVHLLLAAADPLTPDDPVTWRSYAELRGHALASGIVTCSDELVRWFVVNLVRYLTAAAEPLAALTLADAALDHWAAGRTEDAARSHAALVMAKADALFAQGAHAAAGRLRQETLTAMRADPDRWEEQITGLEGKSGAQLRVAGDFARAMAADRASHVAYLERFGGDDPRTLAAANGLIADLLLAGRATDATEAAHGAYRDSMAFYGDLGHPAVLAARNVIGRCHWLAGQYDEAEAVLAEVHRGYAGPSDGIALDEDHPWRLEHEIDYAIARRDKGLMQPALAVLADDVQRVRRRCWRALGADHPQTLAATVVLGSVLYRVVGQAGEGVRVLAEAERRFRAEFPGHPYGPACRAFLAVVRYRAVGGGARWAAAREVPVIRDAADQLAGLVGDGHPLTLTAASALASALACAGDLDAAVKRGQHTAAGLRDLLGPGHPHTRIVEANTEVIRSRLAPDTVPSDALTEIDFTPLPL